MSAIIEKAAVCKDACSSLHVANDTVDSDHTDIGLSLYLDSLNMDPERRELVAKAVLRKLDFILLPMMCVIYLLGFLDKQTLNYANAYGLQADLGLKGRDYSWIASVTNIGYLVFSYPSNICLQKLPIGKFVPLAILSWGTLLICTLAAKNFAGIMTLRFLLGGLEACIGPAWMLVTSMFWTRKEQPLRMCVWLGCNGLAQMLGAGIAWGLGNNFNGAALKPWKMIFLIVGCITFLVGALALFFFPSSPESCKFFTQEEKIVCVWRIASNQTGIKHPKILKHQIKEALLEPRVWFVALQNFAIGVINAAIANFMSALLRGFGYNSVQTVVYQLPTGAFQFVCTIAAGIFTTNTKNTVVATIVAVHIPPLAGIIGIATIDLKHRLALTASCWLLGVIGAAIILNWSLVAANFAGHSKRMTVNGLTFVFYAAGNIVGPFMFVPTEAPCYMTAIKALIGIFASSAFFTSMTGLIMWWSNRKRDADPAFTTEVEDSDLAGFSDRTDHENKGFRYRL